MANDVIYQRRTKNEELTSLERSERRRILQLIKEEAVGARGQLRTTPQQPVRLVPQPLRE